MLYLLTFVVKKKWANNSMAHLKLNTVSTPLDHNRSYLLPKLVCWVWNCCAAASVNKLVSLTWLLWALRSFRRFTSTFFNELRAVYFGENNDPNDG